MAGRHGEAPSAQTETQPSVARTGPILFALGGDGTSDRIRALIVRPDGEPAPLVSTESGDMASHELASLFGRTLHAIDFSLPSGAVSSYTVAGERFLVTSPATPDMRIAYVSCNGQEESDLDRDLSERDIVWQRLADENLDDPFGLLLQGGDQLYADDVLRCHPEVERWQSLPKTERGSVPLTPDITETLRRFYFDRYLITYTRPAFASLAARVPSIMMWDDHDIIDGWGSHPPEMLDSPVGKALFEAAREMFLLFQLAARPGEMPEIVSDKSGTSLGTVVRYPALSVITPDLRSERRLERVMGNAGWTMLDDAFAQTPEGDRILLMSSVPALGPRLSWAELAADIIPGTAEYQDDLRDQWQSRAHRDEWCRMLRLVRDMARRDGHDLTALSGEIHLATRAVMDLGGDRHLNQLVASGIAHRAPPVAWARFLGALATLGDAPLPDHPIRIAALPGHRTRYLAERNYLLLTRVGKAWSAQWNLEESGLTPPLPLSRHAGCERARHTRLS